MGHKTNVVIHELDTVVGNRINMRCRNLGRAVERYIVETAKEKGVEGEQKCEKGGRKEWGRE